MGRGFWAVSPRVLIYLAMRTAVSQRGDIESPWRPGSPAPCFDKRHGAGRADQRGESSFSQRLHARPQANLLQITKTRAGGLPVSPLSAGIFCHQGELQRLRQVKQTQVLGAEEAAHGRLWEGAGVRGDRESRGVRGAQARLPPLPPAAVEVRVAVSMSVLQRAHEVETGWRIKGRGPSRERRAGGRRKRSVSRRGRNDPPPQVPAVDDELPAPHSVPIGFSLCHDFAAFPHRVPILRSI